MNSPSFRLMSLLAIWALLAALAGGSGLLPHLPRFVFPLLVAGLSVSLSVATARLAWLRTAVAAISTRRLLAVHLVRFVGAYFLVLESAGRLPHEFAQRAGWGDIMAAAGALILLCLPGTPSSRRALFGWNLLGAADLLLAVGTAGWLNSVHPNSMREISHLPLALVPLFVVPVLMGSHVVLLRRHFDRSRSALPSTALA